MDQSKEKKNNEKILDDETVVVPDWKPDKEIKQRIYKIFNDSEDRK